MASGFVPMPARWPPPASFQSKVRWAACRGLPPLPACAQVLRRKRPRLRRSAPAGPPAENAIFSATLSESNNAAGLKHHRDLTAKSPQNCRSVKCVNVHAIDQNLPGVGFQKPIMCFSETDFPTPLRPMITHVSPRFTLKLTFCSTTCSSNALLTPRNSK